MQCLWFVWFSRLYHRRWWGSRDGSWLAGSPSAGVLVDFETEPILDIIQSQALLRTATWLMGYDTPEEVLTHICVIDRVECSAPPHGPP